MTPKIKNILIFVGIFIAIIAVYFIFFNKPAAKATITKTTSSTAKKGAVAVTPTVGQEFLTQLLNIQTVKLDDSIFASKAFNSLKDTTDTTLKLNSLNDEGRDNPFSPVGSDVVTPPAMPAVDTTNTNQLLPPGANAGSNVVGGNNPSTTN